jgi:hypothetical protein
MSTRQQNRVLRHMHRGLIACLTLLGMLVDGLQLSDLLLQGAALIWLWSPELQAMESACWRRMNRRKAGPAPVPGDGARRRIVVRA